MADQKTDPAPVHTETPPTTRRSLLRTAVVAGAAAGAATLATPHVARAQGRVLKFQSTWPSQDIFNEFAQDYVTRVNEMALGRLTLELLPAGAVVKAFELQDAVNDGILDGGHGVCAYWYGKHKAFSLFGTPPAFGWTANQMLGWIKYGGGQALYDELVGTVLGLNLVGFLTGPMPTQPLGWFRKDVATADDLKGLKYRTVGLAADLFNTMGTAVTILPGGEIVPSMQTGVIDAAEFNNPSSDRVLGFPDVSKTYMVQSYHQSAECFEVIFNKQIYEELEPDLKAILKYAAEAASADMSWKQQDRYSADLAAMEAAGVKVVPAPEPILKAQLEAWDKVIAELSKEPFFAKVIQSQKDWAKRVVGFYSRFEVASKPAYDHFFGA
ncbi:TRAP transporter substrate-binding protein [Inquilinus limosus]|uniref:TRAP transporter substrate-binding protein n=1 Tax=Inquilinus limosus TaxID=171674 RepID=UPI003F13F208